MTRWPHLLLETGPPIAGVEPGDMLPVNMGDILYLWPHEWRPFPLTPGQRSPVSRPAIEMRTSERADMSIPAWRIADDPPRVEHSETAARADSWIVEEPSQTGSGTMGVPLTMSKWGFRVALDGPALGTVRRFGEHIACRPRLAGTTRDGTHAASEWLVAQGGARNLLVVEQSFDGAMTWATTPRPMGVHVSLLRRAIPHGPHEESPFLDKELAAGIAMQLHDRREFPRAHVGFDGLVRTYGAPHGGERIRLRTFLKLTHGPYDLDDDIEDAALIELASIKPAPIEAIAALMRSLFPVAAAREAALVEECAVLAG